MERLNGYNSKLSDFPNFAGHRLISRPSSKASLRSYRNLSWVKKEINVASFFLRRFERNFTVILMLGNLQCFSILAENFMPHFMPNLLGKVLYNDDEIAF